MILTILTTFKAFSKIRLIRYSIQNKYVDSFLMFSENPNETIFDATLLHFNLFRCERGEV